MTAAERAAAPLLDLPPRDPHAGPVRVRRPGKVRESSTEAGWDDVALDPLDVECTMPTAALEGYVSRLGPVGMALQDADADAQQRVIETVLPAFDPFVHGDTVRFDAACWIVRGGA